jgi:hypothetical protein
MWAQRALPSPGRATQQRYQARCAPAVRASRISTGLLRRRMLQLRAQQSEDSAQGRHASPAPPSPAETLSLIMDDVRSRDLNALLAYTPDAVLDASVEWRRRTG